MSILEFSQLTGWLLFAWAIGFYSGKMYCIFRQIGDIVS